MKSMISNNQNFENPGSIEQNRPQWLQDQPGLRDFIGMWRVVSGSNQLGWWHWTSDAGYDVYFNPWNESQPKTITGMEFSKYQILEPNPAQNPSQFVKLFDFDQSALQNQVVQIEIQIEFSDGSSKWFSLATSYASGTAPTHQRAFGVIRDITNQRRAEQSLGRERQRYQIALEASGAVVWEVNHLNDSVYLSPEFYKILGYTPDEIKTDVYNLFDLIHPDMREQYNEVVTGVLSGAQQKIEGEIRLRAKSGNYRCFLVFGQVIEKDGSNQPIRTSGILTDITERKKVEEALRISEERYRKIVQLQSEMICRYLPDGTITFANQAYCSFFGQPLEKLLGSKFWQFVHRKDADHLRAEVLRAVEHNESFTSLHRETNAAGATRWVEWTDQPHTIVNGVVHEFLSTGRDVTEQVLAERALRESEQRLRLLAENATDVIAILEPQDLKIVYMSPSCKEVFLIEPQELIGTSAFELINEADREKMRETISQQLEEQGSLELEVQIIRGDGEVIWVETVSRVISNPETGEGNEVIAIARDITERKNSEQRNQIRTAIGYQLRAIDQIILSASSGSDFFQPVVKRLADFLECQQVLLLNYDREKHSFRVSAQSSPYPDRYIGEEILIDPDRNLDVLNTGILVYRTSQDLPAELDGFLGELRGKNSGRILLLPILAQQELIGLLIVMETSSQILGAQYVDFLLQVAISLAYGLRQAALFTELREHIHIQDALREVSLKLIDEADLDSLLHSILLHSMEFSGANGGRIYIQTGSKNKLHCVAAVGYASDIADPDIDIEAGLTGKALREGNPVYQENYQDWVGRIKMFDDRKIDNVVAVPVIHGREKYGAIVLNLPDTAPFTKQKELLLSLFAVQAAVVFRKASAYEQERQSSQQLRELHQYLESAREAERARISREIHDELGQRLTALKMDAAWVARRIANEPPNIHTKLKEMQALIDVTISDVRQVATDLRPGLLDEIGLSAALEWKIQDFSARQKIQVNFELDDIVDVNDEMTSIAIYRIFQETLTNIARHARASEVTVKLLDQGEYLLLSIQDNGVGIAPDRYPSENSLGLLGMQERANSIGADFKISSVPQQGTEIELRVPVRSAFEGEK